MAEPASGPDRRLGATRLIVNDIKPDQDRTAV
jgi:hypothetical protein